MDRPFVRRDHHPLLFYDRSLAVAAAQSILDQGGWSVYEVCLDVPAQRWEPRVVIFARAAEAVADAIEAEIEIEPEHDARITACNRRTLRTEPQMGAYLCYVADTPTPLASPESIRSLRTRARGRPRMQVRDGMNPIVVSVGPQHTLREAAKRMTARGVGAAVVIGDELPAPCIITERNILQSNGVGQTIDDELVGSHLTSELVYACADWSLEQAATTMVRGGFRHVIVLDGSEIVGILSMRDIVRCWTSDGASCETPDLQGA